MVNPKVLVAAPVYSVMRYCFKEFLESLRKLDYDNFDILIVENSRERDFFEEIKKEKGISVTKYESEENINLKRLVDSRNMILDFAKEKGYEYVLMMDSDVIVPPDILKKLISHGKEVISGIYHNHFIVNGEDRLLPVAWAFFTEEEFSELKKNYSLPENIASRFDIKRHLTKEEVDSGRVYEAAYPSAGCMLISKRVFEECRYGLLDKENTSDDIYFIDEVRKKGYGVFVDSSIKCDHLIQGKFEKDSSGNFIHPLYKK